MVGNIDFNPPISCRAQRGPVLCLYGFIENVPCGIEKNVGRSVPENVGVGHVGVGCYDNGAREVPDITSSFGYAEVKSQVCLMSVYEESDSSLQMLQKVCSVSVCKSWNLNFRLNSNSDVEKAMKIPRTPITRTSRMFYS